MLGLGLSLLRTRKGKRKLASTPKQEWEKFPTSPCLTATYPKQMIFYYAPTETYTLICGEQTLYVASGQYRPKAGNHYRKYDLVGGVWVETPVGEQYAVAGASIIYAGTEQEASDNIYNDSGLTSLRFAKTT